MDGIAAGSMSSRQVHGPTVLELIPCGAVPRVALWPASTGYATLNLGLALAILDQRPFAISCTHSVHAKIVKIRTSLSECITIAVPVTRL